MSTLIALPPAALIVFRESLESGLVSAVILAYLRRSGRGRLCQVHLLGGLAGSLVSVGIGAVLSVLLAAAVTA